MFENKCICFASLFLVYQYNIEHPAQNTLHTQRTKCYSQTSIGSLKTIYLQIALQMSDGNRFYTWMFKL